MKSFRLLPLFLIAVCVSSARAQSAPGAADASAVWQALSAPAMDPAKFARVENIDIVRDRMHIKLLKGTIQFTQPVNGVVFGAVFHGEGRLLADPPNGVEAYELRLFTKEDKLDMAFSEATFSFTDDLLEEVAREVKWLSGGASDDLYASRQKEREDLGAAYLPRLFKSVLSPDRKRTAYFLADLKTKDKGWVEVHDDAMQPEEIRVGHWGEIDRLKVPDVWMQFPAGGRNPRHAYDDPAARMDYLIPSYKIDASLEENADLNATAHITLQPRYSGERVLLFTLDSNLRLSAVKDSQGRSLEFFQPQEKKNRIQSYGDYVAVVLKDATQASQKETLEFQYGGKRVVYRVGDKSYLCKSYGWYPGVYTGELGAEVFAFRSDFELNFRSPKKFGLIATGNKVREATEGNIRVTAWKSEIPLAVAGFAFGDYKLYTEKAGDVDVQVFANQGRDDLMTAIHYADDDPLKDLAVGPGASHMGEDVMGQLSPADLAKTVGGETANTLRLFQSYFGPYPYKQLAVTNIIGSWGQGWPGLLYLGWFTFLDSTQRYHLGASGRQQIQLTDFFRAHESSHQWWGHRVGWKSYHDQWLSEGFAEFSGMLYVQFRRSPKEFLFQLHHDRDLLESGDLHSRRIESLGPIWMGRRIVSSETNNSSYQNLIYSKGAYVLQMLRMQLFDPGNRDPDHLFKEMMQDYCRTYDNKAASTEDFKAIVEKHMTPDMNLDGNHKMDWFFNQYVYGVGIPQYTLHYALTPMPDGKMELKGKLTRSGVPDNWKDAVPLYAHVGDKMFRIGFIGATQPDTPFNTILPVRVDKFTLNDMEDMLADVK